MSSTSSSSSSISYGLFRSAANQFIPSGWYRNGPQNSSKDYIRDTNDPWMLGVWSLTDTPFEWVWTKVFLGFEMAFSVPAIFIGMYGLVRDDPTYYPILIAYSVAAVLTTTVLTLAVPTKSQASLSSQMQVYAMPDDQKQTVAIANIVFLIPPAIMLMDMLQRTTALIKKGLKAEKEKKRV